MPSPQGYYPKPDMFPVYNPAFAEPVYKHPALSEESLPASLTNKMSTFYLQTPTLAATPGFQQSPVYPPTNVLHTPTSLVMAGPPEHFHLSPEYPHAARRPSAINGSQLSFVDQSVAHPEMAVAHVQASPRSHGLVELAPAAAISEPWPLPMDTAVYNSSFDRSFDQASAANMTIEDLLHDDPFELHSSGTTSIVKIDEDDEELSQFLELDDELAPEPLSLISMHPSPLAKPKAGGPAFGTLTFTPSKPLKKAKLFTASRSVNAAGPAFSFEACSSEFWITEGNYSFQDETARLLLELGSAAVKKKPKTPKTLSKPMLKKAKTTSNLCLQGAVRSNQKVLKSMESGLVSFQVQLQNNEQ